MIEIRARDEGLAALRGKEVASTMVPGVVYWLGEPVGEGGMCVAFLALRIGPEGRSSVVLKIVRPAFVRQSPDAALVIQKEAVALGRLNERVPPTPFVVQLIDTGGLAVSVEGTPMELPWVAVEYVHGGVEGTTLVERVGYNVKATGSAFVPSRAAHALMCLTRGLSAVHEVGVIHRDITPNNVLCCNFGEDEIFKIADFGVARPIGSTATFQGELSGTAGYAAPELQDRSVGAVGPGTDIFGLAAVIYYLLCGAEYFPARNAWEHMIAVSRPGRRSLLDAATLAPELRAREDVCRAIDQELTRATAVDPAKRPATADGFGAALLRWLPQEARKVHSAVRRIESPSRGTQDAAASRWVWTVRHRPVDGFVIRRIAWDGDGRCLAITDRGLVFWNGRLWRGVPRADTSTASGIRFVHRTGPGRWIVGGDAATFASYTADGVEQMNRGEDPSIRYDHFSGDVDDLGVLVGGTPEGVRLHGLVGGWWLKPLAMPEVAEVTALARYDRTRWLVVGKLRDGGGFAALYAPLNWEVGALLRAPIDELVACSAHPDRTTGFGVTRAGDVVWCEGDDVYLDRIAAREPPVSAGIDAVGRAWIGGVGQLWMRGPAAHRGSWSCIWEDAGSRASIVSVFADVDLVLAVTEDGGVMEGRLEVDGRASTP